VWVSWPRRPAGADHAQGEAERAGGGRREAAAKGAASRVVRGPTCAVDPRALSRRAGRRRRGPAARSCAAAHRPTWGAGAGRWGSLRAAALCVLSGLWLGPQVAGTSGTAPAAAFGRARGPEADAAAVVGGSGPRKPSTTSVYGIVRRPGDEAGDFTLKEVGGRGRGSAAARLCEWDKCPGWGSARPRWTLHSADWLADCGADSPSWGAPGVVFC
jgi:hypothetical protein